MDFHEKNESAKHLGMTQEMLNTFSVREWLKHIHDETYGNYDCLDGVECWVDIGGVVLAKKGKFYRGYHRPVAVDASMELIAVEFDPQHVQPKGPMPLPVELYDTEKVFFTYRALLCRKYDHADTEIRILESQISEAESAIDALRVLQRDINMELFGK